jgi:dTMP kinase
MMGRGLVVSFEGGEGSGKSTQFDLACQSLEQSGIPFCAFREPGGTEISEEIREVLLRTRKAVMFPITELLLFEAARAQNTLENIRPAIKKGRLVLLDRYSDSSMAYQGYGRGLSLDQVALLNMLATQGIRPDKTLYFDIDPELGLERGTKNGKDRIEAAKLIFHQRVRSGFLTMAAKERQRFVVLNGLDTVDSLRYQVACILGQLLGKE